MEALYQGPGLSGRPNCPPSSTFSAALCRPILGEANPASLAIYMTDGCVLLNGHLHEVPLAVSVDQSLVHSIRCGPTQHSDQSQTPCRCQDSLNKLHARSHVSNNAYVVTSRVPMQASPHMNAESMNGIPRNVHQCLLALWYDRIARTSHDRRETPPASFPLRLH